MAGVTLGFLKFVLGLDTIAFRKGMTEAERELVVMQKNFANIGKGLSRLGRTMSLAVTAPILGMGVAAVKMAADFETSMNAVGISTQATADEMATMKDLALEIGKATTKSASEAADAMDMLAKAGMTTSDIINGGAKAVVALAEASGSELEPAAAAVTDAMKQFDLTASDLPKIVNQITGAVNESKFAFDDFTLGMGQAGGIAASSGLSFEEFAGALAATSAQFSSGSDAGTSFKTFLQRLTPDTKKAAAAMSKVGFSAYDSAGKLKPLRDIAQQLQDQFAHLSEQDRTAMFEKMFGTDAIRTAIGLMKAGGAGVDAMMAKIAATDAAKQAAQRMKGLNAELEKLRGSLETAAIKLADAGILTAITNFVNKIGELVDKFAELSPETRNTILTLAAIAAAIGPIMVVLGPVVSLFGKLLPHLQKLAPLFSGVGAEAGAAAATLGPLGAVTLPALALAALAVWAAYEHWDEIPGLIEDVNLGLKEAEGTAARFGGKQTWAEAFGMQLGILNNRLIETQGERDKLNKWIDDFRTNFHDSGQQLIKDFYAWREPMATWADGVKKKLYEAFSPIWTDIKNKAALGFAAIRVSAQKLSNDLVMHSIIPDMVDAIGVAMLQLEQKMVEPAKKATEQVKAEFEKLAELADRVKTLLDRLFPEKAEAIRYANDLATINEGLKARKLTAEAAAEAEGALRLERAKSEGLSDIPLFIENEPPETLVKDPMDEIVAYSDESMKEIGDLTGEHTARMAEAWADLAINAIGSMKSMVDAFKSGDILGGIQELLDLVLNLAVSLSRIGVFGKGAQTAFGGSISGFAYGGARALGGPVVPGKSYLVGENGPEFFSSKKKGFISPSRQEQQPQRVIVVPSPYFDVVVDQRAANVAAPMAGKAAIIGVTGSEQRMARRSRRNIYAAA